MSSQGWPTNVPGPQFNQAIPTSQVELTISCTNLLNRDTLSKSDTQCIVSLKDSFHNKYTEIGQTEVIEDNLNPNYVKKVVLAYNFEALQYLKFEIWDIDVTDNDFIGACETTLAEIVAERGSKFKRKLIGTAAANCGELIIVVEELSGCKESVWFQFKGDHLKKSNILLKPDPFLIFWRANEDGSYSVVHKTEAIYSTTKPVWRKLKLRVQTLCNGDYDRSIRIDCMDEEISGDHRLIGSCYTTLNKLVREGIESNIYVLKKPDKQENRGQISLVSIEVIEEPSFLDYIRGGLEMHFAVAIDFTLSNGEVNDPRSLHFINRNTGQPNSYEIALRSVGEIIQPYNTRQLFPGFGFGAKVPPQYQVSHQFALNGNHAHPYCNGVDELINWYRQSVTVVQLYGPTNFAPVIRSTTEIAKQFINGSGYFVLLIVTDGIISDMSQTKQAIIDASSLPLSLIIVGVGDADFSAMDELDADDAALSSHGQKASRDIVQFVPLRRFICRDGSPLRMQMDLAKEVMAEIPEQVVSYMMSRGFKPRPMNMPA